jgi:diacylglycerol kinase family enzyme
MKAILIINPSSGKMKREMPLQVDGEVLGMAPVRVEIIPKALNIIAAS